MKTLLLAILLLSTLTHSYNIHIQRLTQRPIIAHDMFGTDTGSDYVYNYNSAYVPVNLAQGGALAVRVQNLTNLNDPFSVGPSSIVLAVSQSADGVSFENVSAKHVIVAPDSPADFLGAEDPRVVEFGDKLLLFYTAVSKTDEAHGRWVADLNSYVRADLSVAYRSATFTQANLYDKWEKHGALFPDLKWSKSGAFLQTKSNNYLFWGDLSISVAVTKDGFNYENLNQTLLATRSDYFDSELVESGPEPLPLPNGNYLFLYNSARKASIPNPKPNWTLQYNLGYAILDGNDPTKVLERSAKPILSPVLDWETCNTKDPLGLTPDVIFVEGWKPLSMTSTEAKYLVYYQGCDSFMGAAILTASI